MSRLPKAPRAEISDYEASIEALQRWIWHCVKEGWSPTSAHAPHWSHDDNMKAMELGYMLSEAPGTGHLSLFTLHKNVSVEVVRTRIQRMAETGDTLSMKAITILATAKLLNEGRNK